MFGTIEIVRMMKLAHKEEKYDLASTILIESVAWLEDPVRGKFGKLRKLMWEIQSRKSYLDELNEKIKHEKAKTN